ncbi:MAG: LysM peptidoglycan-binding domain-containing protein [Rikenellaceae bacterium]
MSINVLSAAKRSSVIINIAEQRYYIHTVEKGDTFFSLAKLYDIDEAQIVRDNPYTKDGLKLEQVLKIKYVAANKKLYSKKKLDKLFSSHTVAKGETMYSICKLYGIDINVLIEDNPLLDPSALAIDSEIKIRKADVGNQQSGEIQEQISDYVEASNKVNDDYLLHAVSQGETIYSLSKDYNIDQDKILILNALGEGLKEGAVLRLPKDSGVKTISLELDSLMVDRFKTLSEGDVLNIALMLPFSENKASSNKSFVEFYSGVLLALEDAKFKGINSSLNLYNTAYSIDTVRNILMSEGFDRTDLIIGPVYENLMESVVEFAQQNKIAVISPLSSLSEVSSEFVYQIAPKAETKYDKLREKLLSEDNNVVLISGENNDSTFLNELMPILSLRDSLPVFDYAKDLDATELDTLLSDSLNNVFIVLTQSESSAEEFMARVSSVRANLRNQGIRKMPITVVGSSRWMRFNNMDKNLFFKLNVNLISPYFADRSNEKVLGFDMRYISEFSALPSLYSYRGYDVASIFISNLQLGYTTDLNFTLNSIIEPPLQAKYRFASSEDNANNVNKEWVLLEYKTNFTLQIF